ncbi:HAD-IA family hydrolase [Roseovarius salinarum]|uniref:HAD-IA family hydrolase n=1 Tax=Roseovarius salinarum TaxID=1981892 RepID=UPI000C34886A|nr:HAD-IA family hydrolase [Roseovarius salinarum]
MSPRLRLIVFDVDGTLVDSQNDIVAAMADAFSRAGLPAPPRAAVLGIVGLSLDVAMDRLAPQAPAPLRGEMVSWYKDAYVGLRARSGAAEASPLYPGARETLERLHAVPENILGVATGKSRRGLDKLFEGHALDRYFLTRQVSDHHPSKPHPAMLMAALSETGVAPGDAVMVGDTSFDMEMARAAGMRAIGVSWGYHPRGALAGAERVIDDFGELPACLDALWETAA